MKEALVDVGDFTIGDTIINKVRLADDYSSNSRGATRYGEQTG